MRKEVARPKEAVTQIKQGKLDMKDIFVILGSTTIGYFSKNFVPEILEIAYIVTYPIILYLLLSPSDVAGKKNLQVLLQLLRKDQQIYHAIVQRRSKEG